MSHEPTPTTPPPAPAAAKHEHTHRPPPREVVKSVTYCGHTKLIFLWPLIGFGFIAPLLEKWFGPSLEILGWVYIFVVLVVVLAVTVDLSRNFGLVWLLIVAFVLVSGRWLQDAKGITVLGDIYRWFANIEVRYDSGTGLAISTILSVFFVIGLVWSWMNNRYTMSHNEVVHHVWGRGDRSVGRGARVITIVYPDWFEWLLCLAGTIIVYDNTGRTQICRSEHVPLLPWRSKKIDKILESISVTPEEAGASDAIGAETAEANVDDFH